MKKSLNRAVRRAEEYLTTTDKTDLEEELQHKLDKAVLTKDSTVKILESIEHIVGTRTATKEPLSEQLGNHMIATGNELGTAETYGATLVRVGEYEKRLGKAQRVFFNESVDEYLIPMRTFLDGDMKALLHEKATLTRKRLDLDTSKKRQRKVDPNADSVAIERKLVIAQSEFDRHREIVELLANRVEEDQTKHIHLLHKFVGIQMNYYKTCYQIISQLQKELTGDKKNKMELSGEFSVETLVTKVKPEHTGETSATKVYSGQPSTSKMEPRGEYSGQTSNSEMESGKEYSTAKIEPSGAYSRQTSTTTAESIKGNSGETSITKL